MIVDFAGNPVLLGDGSLVTFLTEEQSKNCSECDRVDFYFLEKIIESASM